MSDPNTQTGYTLVKNRVSIFVDFRCDTIKNNIVDVVRLAVNFEISQDPITMVVNHIKMNCGVNVFI